MLHPPNSDTPVVIFLLLLLAAPGFAIAGFLGFELWGPGSSSNAVLVGTFLFSWALTYLTLVVLECVWRGFASSNNSILEKAKMSTKITHLAQSSAEPD